MLGLGRRVATLALSAGVVAACSGSDATLPPASTPAGETPATSPTSAEHASPSPVIVPSAPAAPPLDLADRPFIVFAPVPPKPAGKEDLPLPDGSLDYEQLFEPGAAWDDAASNVDVFKLHAWQLRHYLTDDQLLKILAALRARGIALGMEMEPLEHPDPAECRQTESFEGTYDLEMAQRIKNLGGQLEYVALDNPYSFAHALDGPGACHYTVERVVGGVMDFERRLRAMFPGVVFGSIEGLWSTTAAADMAQWLDTYEAMAGKPFDFLNMDTDYSYVDWPRVALEIEAVADARGVPFALIYTDGLETSNDAWLASVAERMTLAEQVYGITPDHVVLQSWVDQPDRVLPDSDPGAFTALITRYVGERTQITNLELGGSAGSAALSGSVETTSGAPISGANVDLQALALSGAAETQSLHGTVPQGARSALVAMRVNIEGAEVGDAEVLVHDVGYRERGGRDNLVPNPSFRHDLEGWSAYGHPMGTAKIVATHVGDGRSMRLRANAGQVVLVDGSTFAVTAGAEFEFSASLSVDESSFRRGVVAVIFLSAGSEVGRDYIPFVATRQPSGNALTDQAGRFVAPLVGLGAGRYQIRAHYAGDAEHWVASTSADFEILR